jgi:thiamine-phosphate pyrophosphorylase
VTSRSEHLYAIIDPERTSDAVALASDALAQGCAMLQLRAKALDDRAFLDLGGALRVRCSEARVPFVINDRADIARLLHADGLHLGQEDLGVADARRVVGRMQIGVSTHDLRQARQAERDGADLIAFGPVFETSTKIDPDPVVGLSMLAETCATVRTPVVAIGGITPENVEQTLRAGASYAAVISALPRFLQRT